MTALTTRQDQILALVAQGYDNASIGRRLYLSTATVKAHLHEAYVRLGAHNRASAAAIYTRLRQGEQDAAASALPSYSCRACDGHL
jgi:DNA-binding NarL/FixJ family response regulator